VAIRLPVRAVAALPTLVLLAATVPVAGQERTEAPARLTGTVWDSLSARPLAGAEVVLGDAVARALTGSDGAFVLIGPPGRFPVTFRHPDLPTWARPSGEPVVVLEAGSTSRVALATASPPSVLRRLCGGEGSMVGGRVRDLLTLVPLASSSVDVRAESTGGESRMLTAQASADGSYSLCLGTPARAEVRARLGPARSRPLGIPGGVGGVFLRDLFIQVSEPAEIRGLVRDADTGTPLADADVEVLGTRLRTLTRPDGRFLFRGVPPGRLSVVVERLGYGRRVAELQAEGGATVALTLDVFPEAIALDSMIVSVEGGVLERARRGTRFDGLTRPEIDALLPRSVGFDDLLRSANIPGLKIKEAQFLSSIGVKTPGICVETGRTSTIYSDVCQMVEVYLNGVRVAEAETFLLGFDPASVDHFELLSRTEAGVQYGRTPRARNGVLLIYTRGR
jgi:hypothetical protein